MRPAPPDHVGDPVRSTAIVNLPNSLTVLRLLLVPVFAWLLLRDGGTDATSRVLAAVVFTLASVTDFVDGSIARRQGTVTTFGKVVDPIADKALTGTALVGLSILHAVPWWVTVVIVVREIVVTVLRFWVIRRGVIAASRGGKAKTAAQMLAILLYLLPLTGWWDPVRVVVLVVALVLTVVTGVDYAARAWHLRHPVAPVAP